LENNEVKLKDEENVYFFIMPCLICLNILKTFLCLGRNRPLRTKELQKFQETKEENNWLSINVSKSKRKKEKEFKGRKSKR